MTKKTPWYAQPDRKFVAHRSPEEQAAVAAAIGTLPADHQARQAFADGADTIALTHLVSGYPEVRDALCAAYVEASGRLLQRGATFKPWPARNTRGPYAPD